MESRAVGGVAQLVLNGMLLNAMKLAVGGCIDFFIDLVCVGRIDG